ncbi:MAG: hypothetical protein L0H36_03000 [bacterium]|nr:hypothetical protein [bacterium]MDN5835578.1 hypothetical protein [bacterium]
MRPAERTKQGGSVLVYVVVAIILGLLAVGAVYTVHKLGTNVGDNGEIAVETDEGSTSQSTDQSDKSSKTDDESNKSDKSDKSETKPADQSTSNQPSDDATSSSDQVTGDSTTKAEPSKPADKSAADPEVDKLPETGPADVLYSFGAISALSFAGASYVQSRRSLS